MSKSLLVVLRVFFGCLLLTGSLLAQPPDSAYYFYGGRNYGSEATFNPFTTVVNGGFGILQISNRSNRLSDIDFDRGFRNVTYNLSHPFKAISDFGWRPFLEREVLPLGFGRREAQYVPNYELHLLGGGATLRMFQEWYRWHGFPRPTLWAYTSWTAYHFLNEVVENNRYRGTNIDPVSDMYIFNTLGALLFSWERAARFFGQTLHLRDWSFMPAYDPRLGTVENVGQNFMMRYDLPFLKRWSVMYHFGVHGTWGLSYHSDKRGTFSLTGGVIADELQEVDPTDGRRHQTVTLVWTVAMFYDRDNSLLASLILAGTKGYRARLNIYPGLISNGWFSPGMFIGLRKDGGIMAGLQWRFLPFGIASRPR